PELLASAPNSLLYVVEGEKAANAGAAIGLCTTTSAHGAKSASKSDWSPLADRDVVILPDNDDAGRAYAAEVAEILARLEPPATTTIVAIPDLPEHGDLADMVACSCDGAAIRKYVDGLVAGAAASKPSEAERLSSFRSFMSYAGSASQPDPN